MRRGGRTAARRKGEGGRAASAPLAFLHEALQHRLDVALLIGLGFDPVADHLLLRAHVLHQSLDAFGELGHGGGKKV